MARHIGPKSRLSRRVGYKLFPKDDKIFTKRNYPPGMHGQGRHRISGYGARLLEKQKAKWMYGILERQFRRYYENAAKNPGQTGVLLIQSLETRLDNVVYRLGFAQTRPQARQLVSHGAFEVNDKKASTPSYQLSPGDVITVRESKRGNKYFETAKITLAKYQPPSWLDLNAQKLSGKVITKPLAEDFDGSINPQLIIEFYSR